VYVQAGYRLVLESRSTGSRNGSLPPVLKM
jgi:hypothetical protein